MSLGILLFHGSGGNGEATPGVRGCRLGLRPESPVAGPMAEPVVLRYCLYSMLAVGARQRHSTDLRTEARVGWGRHGCCV